MRTKRRKNSKFVADSCDHHCDLTREMFLQLAIGQVGGNTNAVPALIFRDIHFAFVIDVKRDSKKFESRQDRVLPTLPRQICVI
jgi:hypothetical protein